MKVLFDFSLAADDKGGPRTLMEGVLAGWSRRFPEDDLVVFGPEDLRKCGVENAEYVVPRMNFGPRRIVHQQVELPLRLKKQIRSSDVVVVPNIGCTIFPIGAPIVGVLNDIRHLRRPGEFSRTANYFRRIVWPASVSRMSGVAAISQFSLDEAAELNFSLPADRVVSPLGSDHCTRPVHIEKRPVVVCVAHRNSKGTEDLSLIWREVENSLGSSFELVITGISDLETRLGIEEAFRASGAQSVPRFAPYMPKHELHALLAESAAALYLSSYEGFGLVPTEATALGTRVFGYALAPYLERSDELTMSSVPEGQPKRLAEELVRFLQRGDFTEEPVPMFSWQQTAELLRGVCELAISHDPNASVAAGQSVAEIVDFLDEPLSQGLEDTSWSSTARKSARRQRQILKLIRSIGRPRAWKAIRLGTLPALEHAGVLRDLALATLIDVGSNRGQFALCAHLIDPMTKIVSFEPLPAPRSIAERIFARVENVQFRECAIGSSENEMTIHLSALDHSSSLLPIGAKQVEMFPGTHCTGSMKVDVRTLDEEMGRDPIIESPSLLKLDVQGYELEALKGAVETLQRIDFVYCEVSFYELYESQPLVAEIVEFLRAHGFEPARIGQVAKAADGRPLQADVLFEKVSTEAPWQGNVDVRSSETATETKASA